MHYVTTQIQKTWRGYEAREKWGTRKAVLKIQSNFRGHVERVNWARRKASIKIQLFYRKYRVNFFFFLLFEKEACT